MDITWDSAKAHSNIGKHGIAFSDAEPVLFDPYGITTEDERSETELEYALRGKAWKVYWLLLKTGSPVGVREVQRAEYRRYRRAKAPPPMPLERSASPQYQRVRIPRLRPTHPVSCQPSVPHR